MSVSSVGTATSVRKCGGTPSRSASPGRMRRAEGAGDRAIHERDRDIQRRNQGEQTEDARLAPPIASVCSPSNGSASRQAATSRMAPM